MRSNTLPVARLIGLFGLFALLTLVGCQKFGEYDNLEQIESSYTGVVALEGASGDVTLDFLGEGDSGAYGFVWDNPTKGAILIVEGVFTEGTFQVIAESGFSQR